MAEQPQKSIQVTIDQCQYGEALNVSFSDLGGNCSCQPCQFHNDSKIEELMAYMAHELACSESGIDVYHQAERVPEDHQIASYVILVAAARLEPTPEEAFARFESEERANHQQREELSRVITVAALRATDAGAEITSRVRNRATANIERLCMSEEEALRCYLREAALDSALTRVFGHGFITRARLRAEDRVRVALNSSDATAYAEMVVKGERAAQVGQEQTVYVAQVTKYKREGVELVLSLTPVTDTGRGETFRQRVEVGANVAKVMDFVRDHRVREVDHTERLMRGLSNNVIEVRLLGPSGTTLHPERFLPEALDYETDVADDSAQASESYPLEMLTGGQGAWKEMGFDAATRWKYVENPLFLKLFGMSKASFEKLPSWKQIPLKKKHDLF